MNYFFLMYIMLNHIFSLTYYNTFCPKEIRHISVLVDRNKIKIICLRNVTLEEMFVTEIIIGQFPNV